MRQGISRILIGSFGFGAGFLAVWGITVAIRRARSRYYRKGYLVGYTNALESKSSPDVEERPITAKELQKGGWGFVKSEERYHYFRQHNSLCGHFCHYGVNYYKKNERGTWRTSGMFSGFKEFPLTIEACADCTDKLIQQTIQKAKASSLWEVLTPTEGKGGKENYQTIPTAMLTSDNRWGMLRGDTVVHFFRDYAQKYSYCEKADSSDIWMAFPYVNGEAAQYCSECYLDYEEEEEKETNAEGRGRPNP